MLKILLTTVHPAPYIDTWIATLKKDYLVDVLYVKAQVGEKGWKTYSKKNIWLYEDFTFFEKIELCKNYDLVVLCGWGIKENVMLSFALLFSRVKTAFFLDHPIIGTSKTNFFFKPIKKMIIKTADYILPASLICLQYLHKEYGVKKSKMHVFPYAHSKPKTNYEEINNNRQKKICCGKPIEVLIANRFIERKGYDVVFNTLTTLKDQDLLNHFNITIIGNGEQFEYFKNINQSHNLGLKMLGWVENTDYENLVDNCDVFIHASLFEPFGIPPLDAMCRGKNVIVSDGVKSIYSEQDDKPSGLHVYPANNSSHLTKTLKEVLRDKNYLYKKSEQLVRYIDFHYSLDRNRNSINAIIINE